MSSTLMPFLYQTRTLSGLTWRTTSSLARSSYAFPYRSFSLSLRRLGAIDRSSIPTTSSTPPSSANANAPLGRSAFLSDDNNTYSSSKPSTFELEELEEQEELGLLEEPAELESWSPIKKERKGYKIRRVKYLPDDPLKEENPEDTIEFDDDFEFDEQFDAQFDSKWSPMREINDLTNKRANRDSTITSSERSAFQKIFSDIFQRTTSSGTSLLDENSKGAPPGKVDRNAARRMTSSIVSSSAERQLVDKKAAIKKYPPTLRAAAARAIGLLKNNAVEKEAESRPIDPVEKSQEELEALRQPERERIERLMTIAESDVKLWEVMEKEVFTLIPKLGLHQVTQEKKAKSKEKNSKGKNKKQSKKTNGAVPSDEEKEMEVKPEKKNEISPLMVIYGPLYPGFLLLSLRLMDRSFETSSPLALAILPKIKSLGFTSHVLGASTQFYNELLGIYRYQYDDFQGMLKLLGEMETSALELDEETYEIVVDVTKSQTHVHNGARGQALTQLWRMPEFAPLKFKRWQQGIAQSLRDKVAEKNSQQISVSY